MKALKALRIEDSFLLKLISEEQERRQDATATKTASRLISERIAQLELMRGRRDCGEKSAQPEAATT